MDPRLHFEASGSDEDSATFVFTDQPDIWDPEDYPKGRVVIVSVAEEQAMDSYNSMFTCSIHLAESQALELRDWLNYHFPK